MAHGVSTHRHFVQQRSRPQGGPPGGALQRGKAQHRERRSLDPEEGGLEGIRFLAAASPPQGPPALRSKPVEGALDGLRVAAAEADREGGRA